MSDPSTDMPQVDIDDDMIQEAIAAGVVSVPLLDTRSDLNIEEIIVYWIQSNVDRIARAYILKGGWGGWAQVEIALLLEDRLAGMAPKLGPVVITASREVAVYEAPRQHADIVIEVTDGSRKDFIIVELKCEGRFNQANFVAAVKNDVEKIDRGVKKECRPAKRFVFAIGMSEGAVIGMEKEELGHPYRLHSPSGGGPVVVWQLETERVDDGMYDQLLAHWARAGAAQNQQ
jgi:hypothetical protein